MAKKKNLKAHEIIALGIVSSFTASVLYDRLKKWYEKKSITS